MLKQTGQSQTNFHSELYLKIKDTHFLKRINRAISLGFANIILADRYSKTMGRPAKEPEMMLRILILKILLNRSDVGIMEEIEYNLAYRWFIGVNPDDELPEASLLTKFRKLRLYGKVMDDIITEVVRQCVSRGVIRVENGGIIDTTHILANTQKKVPERVMKHLAKKIFKAEEKTDYSIPDYKQIEDHVQAKAVMKEYLEGVIEQADTGKPKVAEAVREAREVLESPLFIEQKGIRSLVDKDARVGSKTRTEQFFGYKSEYMMTPEGIITAVAVENGAYYDGGHFADLMEKTERAGLKVTAVYGDKAYFKPEILGQLKEGKVSAYIPVSASVYKMDEKQFGYNKDSDEWVCRRGNRAARGKNRNYTQRGKKRTELRYVFEKEQCRHCPYREECIGKSKAISKVLCISTSAADYYEHAQWAKTEEFLEAYKTRARIESKNAEQKRFHGLGRCYGYGRDCVTLQSKLTALAVDMKQVATLLFPPAKAKSKGHLCQKTGKSKVM